MPRAGVSVSRDEVHRGEVRRDAPRNEVSGRAVEGSAGVGVPGRRTVTIQGRGSERYSSASQRSRPARRAHERAGFRPDRAAMWAVLLGLLLVLAAATSSHAAVTRAHGALTPRALIASP
jgi:hypothetical protein